MKKIILSFFVIFFASAALSLVGAASAAVSDEEFWRMCLNGASAEEVESALKGGANVNAANGSLTALHYAADNDDPSVVEVLLKNGANIDARAELGDTPLIVAAMGKKPKNIMLLLDYGANAAITDSEGRTAMYFIPDSTPNGVDEKEWEAAVERLRSAIESAPAFTPQVKGLWLECPSFPKDAEVIEFTGAAPWDDNLSGVTYTRTLNGLLEFSIRRQPFEDYDLQSPADVESLIDMGVYNDDIDEDAIEANLKTIKVNENANEFAELYTYPCVTAEYRTGLGEGARQHYELYIFTDVFCFVASVEADWDEIYEERVEGWFKGLEFID